MGSDQQPQKVIVVDVRMKFGSMVWFMVKWAIAAIPAIAILIMFGVVAIGILRGVIGASDVATDLGGLHQDTSLADAPLLAPRLAPKPVTYLPPSPASAIRDARQLLSEGRNSDAYAMAHRGLTEGNPTASERQSLNRIKEQAFQAQHREP